MAPFATPKTEVWIFKATFWRYTELRCGKYEPVQCHIRVIIHVSGNPQEPRSSLKIRMVFIERRIKNIYINPNTRTLTKPSPRSATLFNYWKVTPIKPPTAALKPGGVNIWDCSGANQSWRRFDSRVILRKGFEYRNSLVLFNKLNIFQ
ncbi:hypothetical protein EYR41_008955 [Orbilia oligospora]|uniref:Uncharacterized protein n=1 Tax=Orbilia oligospora TaxID=2813651 RepID=A0A8H2HKL4_ORBOL|nr:hypothetical protein EYR41_008955 [Orbilia oligospora]